MKSSAFTSASAAQWLQDAHSNGSELNLTELLAYRQQPLRMPVPRRAGITVQSGQRLSKTRGRGMEFDEVRHYQAGDDIRAIDWRVTARTGKTHTKLYREEKERPVYLCVDIGASMNFGSTLLLKSVQAAHIAAGLTWHTVQRGDRIGGLIYNDSQHHEIKPQGRQHGALLLLKQLVALQTQAVTAAPPTQNLASQLQRLQQICRPGTDIVLISDFYQCGDDELHLMRGLRRHHNVTAVQVFDPLERQLPANFRQDIDVMSPSSLGENTRGQLPASQNITHKNWQQHASKRQQKLTDQLRRHGIAHIAISAALPVQQQWFIGRPQ
ncbi:MAG: DUF58 domain-containing protein [Aliidiomarina sp.]|uniref:DUF58 domain-containing protein n=1 Tax=Aliidiomarina sp. TaxID=1872439 RepID=UPI0025BF4E96|nr:DUF58 domain-containing protein [Aliidiomarina sp.]MCH8502522.1 DUF58 domain-containing protein [Aliidiomarina sp.]